MSGVEIRGRVAELDGIRALACTAVIGFHAGVPWLQNGNAGVDVFFVLSGWLITGLLLDDLETRGRVGLGVFYARRAARLYPPLAVLVVVVLVCGGPTTPTDALLALTYVTDLSRTFDHDVHWLGHTWSLSVEEHFYLLWPLVVAACRSRRATAVAAGLGLVLSLAAIPLVDPPGMSLGVGGYNFPGARAWELLAGSLLAAAGQGVTLGRPARVLLGLVIPVAAGVAFMSVPEVDAGHPASMLLAVVVTCGLLLAVRSGGRSTRWLALRPLPQLGRISYGAYLAHFPITQALGSDPWQVKAVVAFVAAFGLASASWWLLERPVQRWVRTRTEGSTRTGSARDVTVRTRAGVTGLEVGRLEG